MILKHVDLWANCEVHTIDSYQVREAEILILITTRTGNIVDEGIEKLQFFVHDQRFTVALSRARQGLLIIADFLLSRQNDFWKRYIETATQHTHTPIVGPRYLATLALPSQRKGEIYYWAQTDVASYLTPPFQRTNIGNNISTVISHP